MWQEYDSEQTNIALREFAGALFLGSHFNRKAWTYKARTKSGKSNSKL